jgi:hypothetical protein
VHQPNTIQGGVGWSRTADGYLPTCFIYHRSHARGDYHGRKSLCDHWHSYGYRRSCRGRGGFDRWRYDVACGYRPRNVELQLGRQLLAVQQTIKSRAVDDSGNLETPGAGVAVTVGTGGGSGCTVNCSIWPATTVPAVVDEGPDSPVELGVKFRSDIDGVITGIRFYKAATNTGVHIGNLWSASGQLLGSATFSGESASGCSR